MLGSMICRRLLQGNYQVKALCLPHSKAKTLEGLDLEIVKGDVLDLDFLQTSMKGCQYIIHVAAMTDVWPRRIEKVREVNLQGSMNVRQAAPSELERMVYIGSASSFTEGPKHNPGDENSPFSSDRYGMDYIDSKYQAQQYLLNEQRNNGFPVIVVNPTFMIGPYDSGPSSGKMIIGLSEGSVPGYTKGGKNFVYSGDVAQAAVNALSMGRLGECYIAGHENLEFREFFSKVSGVMNKKFTLKKIPPVFILIFGFFSSVIARITGKAPKLSYGMATMASVSQYFNSEKAVKELNMPQTPIEEAITESLTWFRENGYVK